jgi:hypothetical protein
MHVSACLQQLLPGKKDWYPLVFFPKKLEAAQQKYSAFDRELFTCYCGIRHFRYVLDDRRFAIFTDHNPQVRMSNPWMARQSRHLSYVAEYMSDICHIAEAANVVADTLSRLLDMWQQGGLPLRQPLQKRPLGLKVAALQEGKQKSSQPSLPGVAAGVADIQPAAGISFPRMVADQVSCPTTLQAT